MKEECSTAVDVGVFFDSTETMFMYLLFGTSFSATKKIAHQIDIAPCYGVDKAATVHTVQHILSCHRAHV